MAMHNIPLEEKELVTNRLAEGQSYSESIKNTSIKSKDTVHRIVQQKSNTIERIRQQYLKKIKKFGASDSKRAEMWSRMVYATKLVGKDATEHPDWQARATALKYIDSLADFHNAEKLKLEVTDKTPPTLIDPESQEAEDFNQLFKKFLEKEG